MTTGSLTPPLALAYLRELSLDVRAAVVLDGAGAPIAGDAALAERARALLPSAPDEGEPAVSSTPAADGTLIVARAVGGLGIAALAGELALLPLLEHDVRVVLGELSRA
jgi:hypothetical protein